jgi:adenosine deaminase
VSEVRDLALLPKAHLHLHLEAAVRPEVARALAAECGVSLPPLSYTGDFSGFADAFLGLLELVTYPGMLERFILEAALDAAAEGVVYLELGVSPQYYAERFGSTEAALEAVLAASAAAAVQTGVAVGAMVTVDRTAGVDEAVELAELAARFAGRGVASLGLANNEVGHPANQFEAAFAIAKAAGLASTPHAGELAGASAVAAAIDVLHADRVQHGIRAIEDQRVVERLSELDICLDVCPTSNVLLGIASSYEAHPLPRLLEAGVACSINADDPTLFGAGILDEYENCRSAMGLTDEQLALCARSSVRHSPLGGDDLRAALDGIDAWLASQPATSTAPSNLSKGNAR